MKTSLRTLLTKKTFTTRKERLNTTMDWASLIITSTAMDLSKNPQSVGLSTWWP